MTLRWSVSFLKVHFVIVACYFYDINQYYICKNKLSWFLSNVAKFNIVETCTINFGKVRTLPKSGVKGLPLENSSRLAHFVNGIMVILVNF